MRLGDFDALKAEVALMFGDKTHITESVCELIDNAPTVEAKTTHDVSSAYDKGFITAMKAYGRPQGKWIMQEGYDGDEYYECSICKDAFTFLCGTPKDNNYNFCPNCGADMRKDGAE